MPYTYVIADLHGRFDLFDRALAMIEGHAGGAGGTMVVLGDFIDRGPEPRSIVDGLIAGPSRPEWCWVTLQGNHEDMMLQVIEEPRKLRWWIGNGGAATLRSYGYERGDTLHPLKVPEEHIRWLQGLPLTHEDTHRIYVHAGVPLDQAVSETSREMLQWMLYPHGSGEAVSHASGKHIVHGHHQSASHPLLLPHRTNLDSYAWFTDRLAIGVFDDDRPGGPVDILWASGRPGSG